MLSSSALQWIALITMTIDHIGFLLFPKLTILRVIGRIAMPIFVFCLAEGFIHTKSRQKYFMRLGILAVISELVFILERYYTGFDLPLNVVMTLALSFIAMLCAEKGGVGSASSGLLFHLQFARFPRYLRRNPNHSLRPLCLCDHI